MSRPIIRIHDLATDEIIDREMTDAEYEQYLIFQAEDQAKQAGAEAKAQAKAALLERLGITQDEANLLLS